MINSNAKNRIDAIEFLFKEINVDNVKFEAQLTYFLLVVIYGAAQYCIKTIFIDWMNPAIIANDLSRLSEKIDKLIQTPSLHNIRDLLLISNRRINVDKYSTYSRILSHRHTFAHGEKDPTKLEGVTMIDVKKAFDELKILLDDIENILSN